MKSLRRATNPLRARFFQKKTGCLVGNRLKNAKMSKLRLIGLLKFPMDDNFRVITYHGIRDNGLLQMLLAFHRSFADGSYCLS